MPSRRYAGIDLGSLHEAIGWRVAQIRTQHCETQTTTAQAVGLTQRQLAKFEGGATMPVSVLVRLAEHWDCGLDDLVPVGAGSEEAC